MNNQEKANRELVIFLGYFLDLSVSENDDAQGSCHAYQRVEASLEMKFCFHRLKFLLGEKAIVHIDGDVSDRNKQRVVLLSISLCSMQNKQSEHVQLVNSFIEMKYVSQAQRMSVERVRNISVNVK
jgi:hypothetical protein